MICEGGRGRGEGGRKKLKRLALFPSALRPPPSPFALSDFNGCADSLA
jgi:hypothetical protein